MTDPAVTGADASAVRKKWLARLLVLLAVVAVLTVACELFARYHLGLGDPPLSMSDPQIGYLFRPNQTCHRFGHLIHYNAYCMRWDDFPAHKSDPRELRVMVLGNSIINGGALTDQSGVCTSILEKALAAKLHRPVVVGNISAGGWGPLNEWPYVQRYGLFDADVVMIVLNSNNAASPFLVEPVAGADPAFPDHKPWCATWEGITRYLPRYVPGLGTVGSNEGYHPAPDEPRIMASDMQAIGQIITTARARGAKTYVVLHWTRSELEQARAAKPGWLPPRLQLIKAASQAAGVTGIISDDAGAGPSDYRDDIHPNDNGQKLLASLMFDRIAR
jgi:lysophospholipase L1-like esterase